ncbi:phospholipase C/P1 nuclease domain-containing protein [Armillaria nabsnona]|nr:phospholipase C/P1 nuclease domain-containing protein [Armillaria nabsnona]
MKTSAWLSLLAASTASIPGVVGWGVVGHEIVATIAQIHLHPAVLPSICRILNFTSTNPNEPECHLAPIAGWADRIRYQKRWSASLHYIGALGDHPSDSCIFPGDRGWAGKKDINVLGGVRNTTNLVEEWVQNDRAGFGEDDDVANEALKFLVHFVGDMHMPLHLTGRDRGGNSVKVKFDGRQTNLHSLWDSLLISKSLRTIPHNYTRPLPSRTIEYNLRGTIYDSYIRRIMWEGILGKWEDEVSNWLTCPTSKDSSSSIPSSSSGLVSSAWQQAISLWSWMRGPNWSPDDTDDDTLCPYYWATPIHALNCEIIWPPALDKPPYSRTKFDQLITGHKHGASVEEELALFDQLASGGSGGPYLELDTPEYAGAIYDQWIIEKLLAQGGIRLAGILNYLFAPLEGSKAGLSLMHNY